MSSNRPNWYPLIWLLKKNGPLFITISNKQILNFWYLALPDIHRKNLVDSNEEYVSYNVDPLFTSIPLTETINFTLDEIYIQKKLEPFAWNQFLVIKWAVRRLYLCEDSRLIKQVDGCPVGGLISVVLSNIFCVKMVLQTLCWWYL